MFSLANKARIARGILLKDTPLYVQFYITARCNLTCEQCNIIYANSDVRECSLDEIERIAENLAKVGTAIVLLTGGEPFVRQDLPEIVRAFSSRGIHVRMQTNGLATEQAIAKCVEYGARDISISLDSLRPDLQDSINGGFPDSWRRALRSVSVLSRYLPAEDNFAAFGCVLSPRNIDEVAQVIEFGTRAGWYTSLVPIHVTERHRPMNFRTYDESLRFRPEHYDRVSALLRRVHEMKSEGYLLYDSDEYLADIDRFVRGEPIRWRERNGGVCDSPGLYFAVLPNGCFSVCCDHRLPGAQVPVYGADFVQAYRETQFRSRVVKVASECSGCMFGSFPEITITARYLQATLERAKVFLTTQPKRPWPITVDALEEIAADIRSTHAQRSTDRVA